MSRPIIEVSNLSKVYQLGELGASSLREEFSRFWSRTRNHKPAIEAGEFWALRDVSFEIQPGEVVGIIGRNGAGKSTLLKILSRITEPTAGRAVMRGRVASLLEVGTGFHPDLTGRENIFLNGAILGMSRAEIRSKFDDIVAFAEVEEFIDTPVKRYSSGMYVRLAFAVAAHLEPKILIVDEVLAVGDAAFQEKCLGKLEEVSQREGRTVLLVSHNAGAIQALCTRCLLLQRGGLVFSGEPSAALDLYLQTHNTRSSKLSLMRRHKPSEIASILSGELLAGSVPADTFRHNDALAVELTVQTTRTTKLSAEFLLRNYQRQTVAFHSPGLSNGTELVLIPGTHTLRCELVMPPLAEGNYSFDVALAQPGIQFLDYIESGFNFSIRPTAIGPRRWNFQQQRGQGCVLIDGQQLLASTTKIVGSAQ